MLPTRCTADLSRPCTHFAPNVCTVANFSFDLIRECNWVQASHWYRGVSSQRKPHAGVESCVKHRWLVVPPEQAGQNACNLTKSLDLLSLYRMWGVEHLLNQERRWHKQLSAHLLFERGVATWRPAGTRAGLTATTPRSQHFALAYSPVESQAFASLCQAATGRSERQHSSGSRSVDSWIA